jgi:hypothetical protein
MKYTETIMQPGDILLWVGTRFVSKRIREFMQVYAKRKNIKGAPSFNHGANAVDDMDNVIIGESQAKGYLNLPIEKTEYPGKENNFIILTPAVPYSEKEKTLFSRASYVLSCVATRYDFASLLLWQPLMVVTGKWYGRKGNNAEGRMYCTEACGHCANKVRPGTFEEASTNPLDIFINDNYVVKYAPDSIAIPEWKAKAKDFTNNFYK